MGFIKKVVGGVGKVVTGIGKGVASIFTGGRSGGGGQAQPAAAPAPQSAPRFDMHAPGMETPRSALQTILQRAREQNPRLFMIGDPPDAPYIQKPWQRLSLPNPSMGGGSFGGMGQTGMGGMGSFGGMPQSSMMSSPMPSAPNGGQSFYGGASNNVLDRIRMMRQGMGSPMMGMPYGGIRRSPFGMM